MEPNFIGPVMSSYFARHTRHALQQHSGSWVGHSRVPAPSLATRLRQRPARP